MIDVPRPRLGIGGLILASAFALGCGDEARTPVRSGQQVHVHMFASFWLVDEPAPAGWQPTAPVEDPDKLMIQGRQILRLDNRGVGTAIVTDHDQEIGRVAHVDRTAPVWVMVPDEESRREDMTLAIPVVGPSGEPLTQLARLYDKNEMSYKDFTLKGAPFPRADGLLWQPKGRSPKTFLVKRVEGTDDLIVPLDKNGVPVKLPEGALGVRPVGRGRLVLAWAVKFADGWGISLKRDASTALPQRYVEVATEKGLAVGRYADGSCEAADRETGTSLRRPSCSAAAQAVLDAIAHDRDQAAAVAARERQEREAAEAQKAAADRAEADRLRRNRATYDA